MRNKSSIVFYGGVGSATGANFLLEVYGGEQPLKVLVDCGLFQGSTYATEENRRPFDYDPASIDALFVTHAHADHIGRIPKLVRDGFKGTIYSTEATRLISEIMFQDALKIMRREAGEAESPVLYTESDISKAFSMWKELSYHEKIELQGGVSVCAKDAGHILGSSYFEFNRSDTTVVFSGDLGNTPSALVKDSEPLGGASYLVIESVYGDRIHEDRSERREKLRQAILEVVKKKGTLVIPAFSLERSQVILYEINNMVEDGEVPSLPVFLDSPLAIKVTKIYKQLRQQFKSSVQEEIKAGDDIFNFPKLKFTQSVQESRQIDMVPNPKVIIAGGGMSEGGRVVGHEKNYLPDERNTILLVGYQALGTLGRLLQEGMKQVPIEGVQVLVRARVVSIHGYSSHKDSNSLLEFVSTSAHTLKKVFVAMGEPKSSLFLSQRIQDELGIDTVYPELGKSYPIDF